MGAPRHTSITKVALNAFTRLAAAGLPPEQGVQSHARVRISAAPVSALCAVPDRGLRCPSDVATRMLDRDDELACRNAVPPSTAARDVVWLATVGLLADAALPTGRFWRHCHQIEW